MKKIIVLALFLALLYAAPVLADKAPAVEAMGSAAAAAHLTTHLQAYTHGWDGVTLLTSAQDGCEDYGHVHCYGRRVSVWDTPKKGSNKVSYYPGTNDGYLWPEDEFQLVDVVEYEGKYYANIRTYVNGYARLSGFVNADFIGCDCEVYDFENEVPTYEYNFGPFSLK